MSANDADDITRAANERRLAEGNECIKKAEEFLKTSVWRLKTKPNHDSAAHEYERAAVCYRNAERLAMCRDAYVKAAECHAANRNHFHEAKAKESAALASRDAKDLDKATELFEASADAYITAGTLESAAMSVDKAAKALEHSAPEKAAQLYAKGLTLVAQEDRAKFWTSFAQRLLMLQMRTERFAEALDTSLRLIEKYAEIGEPHKAGALVLGMVLLELRRGDSIAALKALYHLPEAHMASFGEEIGAAKALVRAFESYDDEAFQACLRQRGVWRSMDNEYLRLMRTLKAPRGDAAPTTNKADAKENDDEEEEDLR